MALLPWISLGGRAGTFVPTMVPKGARPLTDVDDMIISFYTGGMYSS